jgi:hypothetical protein
MDAMKASGSAVVARFLDGRVLKGSTHDFAPNKPVFHLHGVCDASTRGLSISISELKAVFFVKSFGGDAKHVENLDIASAPGQGRKILVTFSDDEVVAGFTTGYEGQAGLLPRARRSAATTPASVYGRRQTVRGGLAMARRRRVASPRPRSGSGLHGRIGP